MAVLKSVQEWPLSLAGPGSQHSQVTSWGGSSFSRGTVLTYSLRRRGFSQPPGWRGMPALARRVVRLKGSTAVVAGWGLVVRLSILHLVQLQGPGGAAQDAGTVCTSFLPVLFSGPGAFTRISPPPLTGALRV